MPPFRITTLRLFLLLVLIQYASAGMTYFLLKGTGSNCVSVDPLPGSVLNIQYLLPDLKVKDKDGNIEEAPLDTTGMEEAEAALLQRQREVAIKRARQGKDVSIAISQRTPFPHADMAGNVPRERPRNAREQPSEKSGSIRFETSSIGGPVQICIHSLFANKKMPYLIGLDITEQNDLEAEQVEQVGGRTRGLSLEATDAILTQLSGFTKEMIRAESLVRNILASADVNKKEEADFYEQSIRMEKSIHLWPMLQGVALLVAATYQVRYILHWMKARHIC